MNVMALANAFRDGQVWGPRGRIKATAATLTRRSLIVFTAQTVLKVRVPERIPPFDQSLLSVRAALSARERAVGRALSPVAYLDNCEIRRANDESLILVNEIHGGEPVVATWRQPLERRADVLLVEGGVDASAFDAAMDQLALFHEQAREPEPESRYARPTLTADRWEAALASLTIITPEERMRLADETREWLAALDKVLLHRTIERRIRDGHGELSLEHLFLVDPPVFIDAGDGADDDFMMDTAEDVAQLAMELDLAAGVEMGDAVAGRYAEAAIDQTLMQVLPLYKRLVAVRTAAMTAADSNAAPESARAFVDLALGYRL